MFVRDTKKKSNPECDSSLYVYCVYWVDGVTYFLTSPKSYEGFLAYSEDDVEVVDNRLGADFVLINSSDGDAILLHEALNETGLLDAVFEEGPVAYRRFVERLGCEP